MKIASFIDSKGRKNWGFSPDGVNLVSGLSIAPSVLDFLRDESPAKLAQLKSLGAKQESFWIKDVQFLACVPNPPSMRDGYAFRQHVEAARRNRGVPMIEEFDHFPVFYFTNHYGVVGTGEIGVQQEHLKKMDFELEAAVVIGSYGVNIPAEKADEHIFGYTIMNDFSARHLQMEEMKLSLGPAKGKDFATALGPWLVTRDELSEFRTPSPKGERFNLEMTADWNGKEVSRGNMSSMNWTFAQIIERVSYGVPVYPGDVIGSGTVGTGCFLELNGTHKRDDWLRPGDKIVLKIQGLGVLENTIKETQNSYRVTR